MHPRSSRRNVENDAAQQGLARGYLAPLDHADPARCTTFRHIFLLTYARYQVRRGAQFAKLRHPTAVPHQ
jgi:hypothetical protein